MAMLAEPWLIIWYGVIQYQFHAGGVPSPRPPGYILKDKEKQSARWINISAVITVHWCYLHQHTESPG